MNKEQQLRMAAAGYARRRHRRAPESLSEIEKKAVIDALHSFGGNRRKAAKRLGIGVATLYRRLRVIRELSN